MKTISNSIFSLLLTVGCAAQAQLETSLSKVTRDAQTEMRVIYNIWSTEYPSPVIDVNSKNKNGTTVVVGYKNLQTLENSVPCEIKNGLYHPWSVSKNSAKGYLTIAKSPKYIVEKENSDLSDSKVLLKKGTLISEVVYLSEGFCYGKGLDNSAGKTKIKILDGFNCQAIEDESKFRLISEGSEEQEQWIEVSCKAGGQVYIQDSELLKVTGVKEGEITGYGSVGPAKGN